jgi:hypothetical protein
MHKKTYTKNQHCYAKKKLPWLLTWANLNFATNTYIQWLGSMQVEQFSYSD